MQKINRLKSYLDLTQLLQVYKGTHEENRLFALEKGSQKPLELLAQWQDENQYRVEEPLNSDKYLHYLTIFTSIFGFVMLTLGFSSGVVLLSYTGAEPVNIIYLLLIMVALPLFSMSLSLLSMFSGNSGSKFFSHFSPLYYLEKVINFFPFAQEVKISELPFSLTLTKWIFLKRVQLFSLLFSLGLLISLLLMVIAKDIAFGWSTTLQISPETFQSLLATLSLPWQTFLPSAVPSVELVELSHFFRLGEKLDANMIQNADKLGAWWKFLAMATFTYALVLRLLFWLLSHYGFRRELSRELVALDGVAQILKEFKTPYISTQSQKVERHLEIDTLEQGVVESSIEKRYENILGWNFTDQDLLLINDHFKVNATNRYGVGGRNSFSEDNRVVERLEGSILLYVKAWEPPTMDFIDFLEDILRKSSIVKVEVTPLGTTTEAYESRDRDMEIWLKKLQTIHSEKLGVIDV